MDKYMIVGGSGFLGSHLIENLVNRGSEVTVVDIVAPDNAWRLAPLLGKIEYKWMSSQDMKSADFDGVEYVVYLAAQPDAPLAMSSPLYTFQTNIPGLINVLEILRSETRLKLIYISSDAVYGEVPPERLPITEKEPPKPTNVYGVSKAGADFLCQCYLHAYGLPIVVLRSGTIFGPKSRLKQVIPIFITQALMNEAITIEGDGSQSRDFNYVGNVVDAIILATESGASGVFNVGSGEERTILDAAKRVIEVSNSKSQIVFKPWRAGEKGLRLPLSIERAKREFGYVPRVSFRDGLTNTIEWIKSIKK